MKMFTIDIETLATPETSGYGLVIPNYAVARVPETLTSDIDWLYVQIPIQEQLDRGLKMDAKTMNFWFNICAQEFPLSLCEMQKSFLLEHSTALRANGVRYDEYAVSGVLKFFLHGSEIINNDIKIFGNGCHFDCSILQDNHRVMYNDGNLWNYSSPNNVRTLRLLLSEDENNEMKDVIEPYLDIFVENVNKTEWMYDLCLHNPVYDAVKEALMVRYILDLKKSS